MKLMRYTQMRSNPSPSPARYPLAGGRCPHNNTTTSPPGDILSLSQQATSFRNEAMPANELRAGKQPQAKSRAVELVGSLLIGFSVYMFIIAHRHHNKLLKRPQYHTLNGGKFAYGYDSYTSNKIYEGAFISDIIKGIAPYPGDRSRLKLKFRPGTLAMTSVEAIQYCYIDMKIYKEHFDKLFSVQVSVSDTYKIIYRSIPKSASSSSRKVMMNFFDGKEKRMKHYELNADVLEHNYNLVSFIREPLDRFYSSYDEAFLRMGPWWASDTFAEQKPTMYKTYISNKHKVDPYPYLYEGINTIDDYRKLFCPNELLEQKNGYLMCSDVETIDNGNLTSRFEQFVRDYDGTKPFDTHLKLQVAFLMYNSKSHGAPLPITNIYNASEAQEGWNVFAKEKGVTIPTNEMTRARKNSRKLNLSLVSNETKRKICKILALDYCCLNLELPKVCRSNIENADDVLCTLEEKVVKNFTGIDTRALVIQSYRDYR